LLQHGKPEKRDQYVAALRQATTRLRKLIEGFLEISKLISETGSTRLLATDVNELIALVLQKQQADAVARDLSLLYETEQEELQALTEPEMLRQIVSHLLENALNYTPPGGQITVTTAAREREGKRWVTVTVQDTGPGIAAEEIPRLFERFYRGEAASDFRVPGTGLGLAICQEIVKKLEGRITVDSQPGSGAAFTVWLRAA
jgi:two-component system phosphate regulon sensor histidine kinase PhoR